MLRIFSIFLLCLFYAACSKDPSSPEEQVRNTLSALESAAEERSTSEFMQYISDDYLDGQGNTKQDLKRYVQALFIRNQKINIFTFVKSMDINSGIATVEISTAMASRDIDLSQENNRLKADTQSFSVILSPNKNKKTWLVQSTSWERGW